MIYTEFETLDLFGPLGAILPRSDYYTLKLVNIHNADAPKGLESSIRNGIGILPSLSLTDALTRAEERFDTLFIPGGEGMRPLVHDAELLRQIATLVDRAANVFTVCTGSVLLAATGRLDGRRATTNKRAFDQLTPQCTSCPALTGFSQSCSFSSLVYDADAFFLFLFLCIDPGVRWQKRARWVEDGKFLTASGVTAGLDAAFAFLANTYVAPADREADAAPQEVSVKGDKTAVPGFSKEKALEYARGVAFTLEYRWLNDPTDDPFVELPQSTKGTV